ncbi:MAG: hypothetical protein ABL912_01755 [Novosphingobium sp.]
MGDRPIDALLAGDIDGLVDAVALAAGRSPSMTSVVDARPVLESLAALAIGQVRESRTERGAALAMLTQARDDREASDARVAELVERVHGLQRDLVAARRALPNPNWKPAAPSSAGLQASLDQALIERNDAIAERHAALARLAELEAIRSSAQELMESRGWSFCEGDLLSPKVTRDGTSA